MFKAICYKEWIKTRLYAAISLIFVLATSGYAILRVSRVVRLKGVEHIWEILLSRDVMFIETLRYLPLVLAVVLAIVQFIPEMMQKRLKLTLHLPYPRRKMIMLMLAYGGGMLLVFFLLQYAIVWGYLQSILAPELVSRIILTSLPWYICGLNAYFLAAWICLEATWRIRFVNALITAGVISAYFLSTAPQAYDGFLPILAVFTLLTTIFPLLSVHRFREGKQD